MHAAGARRVETREQREQRALAGARGADDGDRIAAFDREGDVLEDRQRTVGQRDGLAESADIQGDGGEVGACMRLSARSPTESAMLGANHRRSGGCSNLMRERPARINGPSVACAASPCFATLMLCLGSSRRCMRPTPAKTPATAQRTVLVMGDSLSAAYGLAASQGWVALTAGRIAKEETRLARGEREHQRRNHRRWRGAHRRRTQARAAQARRHRTRRQRWLARTAAGANAANLERMIKASKTAGAQVLLVGMRIPPNYGRDYTQGFEGNYTRAREAVHVAAGAVPAGTHRPRPREFPGRQPPSRGERAAQAPRPRVEDPGADAEVGAPGAG